MRCYFSNEIINPRNSIGCIRRRSLKTVALQIFCMKLLVICLTGKLFWWILSISRNHLFSLSRPVTVSQSTLLWASNTLNLAAWSGLMPSMTRWDETHSALVWNGVTDVIAPASRLLTTISSQNGNVIVSGPLAVSGNGAVCDSTLCWWFRSMPLAWGSCSYGVRIDLPYSANDHH